MSRRGDRKVDHTLSALARKFANVFVSYTQKLWMRVRRKAAYLPG